MLGFVPISPFDLACKNYELGRNLLKVVSCG